MGDEQLTAFEQTDYKDDDNFDATVFKEDPEEDDDDDDESLIVEENDDTDTAVELGITI